MFEQHNCAETSTKASNFATSSGCRASSACHRSSFEYQPTCFTGRRLSPKHPCPASKFCPSTPGREAVWSKIWLDDFLWLELDNDHIPWQSLYWNCAISSNVRCLVAGCRSQFPAWGPHQPGIAGPSARVNNLLGCLGWFGAISFKIRMFAQLLQCIVIMHVSCKIM